MKVKIEATGIIRPLEDYLWQRQVQPTNQTIAALGALLVDKKVATLAEVLDAFGVTDTAVESPEENA